ncbi:serine/threonine protein kinase [Actinokineospora sp. PR83]|uniref:serine/threonine-protein kinase n=1 Tax=Actinokineospora sp. PR83 TaxID=2884908 RepID=UPI001F256DCB|nr:serine/threonine-protein kinase [Actinokineospora sp. PR83]MCG8919413.1 serine/threonine protein kinase [Actinokineospora sp. PR83]
MGRVAENEGERLIAGRYRLGGLLGQGSMGTVWAAYDEFLRRNVAVKEVRLPPGMPAREADELRERTLREARAIAVVSHPNVVTLHDVAQEDGEPFVVMEYVPSVSLAELLRDHGPMGTARAAVVGDAVAAGLQAAHEAGITHRDVKPGNVLVGPDGRVKLTDFGIARNVSERTLTKSGVMLGSPAYIAPEIAAGGDVTPRADLWGLGATLFAAVDGHAPYDPDGQVVATLAAVVDGEVPQPEYDGPLREVITGLMVKDPAARLPLDRVRELLHPLLPGPGDRVFDELAIPVRELERPTVVTEPVGAPTPRSEVSAPLAAVPGPLPFEGPPRRGRRGPAAATALGVVAAVLFAAAATGGFTLVRVVGGAPVAPPVTTTSTVPPPTAPVRQLVPRAADASPLAGTQGAAFSVPVPEGWVKFVEPRRTTGLPDSTRVHWVSPDGGSQVTVERYAGFSGESTLPEYLRALAGQSPGYQLVGGPQPDGEGPRQITYRTADSAQGTRTAPSAAPLIRSNFASLVTVGADLWVVGVSVPIEQEDSGRRMLFTQVAPGFKVTG